MEWQVKEGLEIRNKGGLDTRIRIYSLRTGMTGEIRIGDSGLEDQHSKMAYQAKELLLRDGISAKRTNSNR